MDIKNLYIVETKLGRWPYWISTTKKGPQPNEHGLLKLYGKGHYAVDPSKFREFRWKRHWPLSQILFKVGLWRENEPQQMDLLTNLGLELSPLTSQALAAMGKSRKIEQLMNARKPQFDLVKLALIFSIFINGLVVIYLVASGRK